MPRFVAVVVAFVFAVFAVFFVGCQRPALPAPEKAPTQTPTKLTPIAAPIAEPAHDDAADSHDEAAHEDTADDGRDHRALFVDRVPIAERNAVVDVAGLIETHGPFKYAKDGSVFQNREKRLPKQKPGFYREYTVDTPGEDDRGARRLIAGDDGSLYYTRDHYASFVVLREPR